MSKMKELSMVLDELITCGETLIKTANALKEIYSNTTDDPDPTSKSPKKSGAKSKSAAAAPEPGSELKTEPATAKEYTKEEVRGILAAKSSAGHANEVRALLAKFGAKQLKQVDPKDYAALVQEAEVIGNVFTVTGTRIESFIIRIEVADEDHIGLAHQVVVYACREKRDIRHFLVIAHLAWKVLLVCGLHLNIVNHTIGIFQSDGQVILTLF